MQSDRRPVKLISKINSGLSFDLSIGFENTAVVPLFYARALVFPVLLLLFYWQPSLPIPGATNRQRGARPGNTMINQCSSRNTPTVARKRAACSSSDAAAAAASSTSAAFC